MTIEELTTLLGWCSVINIGVLALSGLVVVALKDVNVKIHSGMFGVDPTNLPSTYFQYLGNYKIAIIVLNLAPWVSLKLMA
jgi:hypothetical protein